MTLPLLAWRMAVRDWRAGELRVIALALWLAVTSVTAVAFVADRVSQALRQQAHAMLGADLIVSAMQPLPPRYQQLARQQQLMTADEAEFPSMVAAAGAVHLATIRAVSADYPLRGEFRISRAASPGITRSMTQGPAPQSVWLEPELMDALQVTDGATITIGYQRFTVAGTLLHVPAALIGTAFTVAPRLVMPLSDLAATGLVTSASRVQYRQLFAGTPAQLQRLRPQLAAQLQAGERIEGLEDAGPELRNALQRGERFLRLAALVTVLLAVVAVAMAARQFVARRLDGCAMLRCFGIRPRGVLLLYTLQLLIIAALTAGVGMASGFAVQAGLVALMADLVGVGLPPPGWSPLLQGGLIALLALLGFAGPLLLQLGRVPPLRVMRRELGRPAPAGVVVYGVGALVFTLLVVWQMGEVGLALYVLGGVSALLLSLALIAGLLIYLLRVIGRRAGRAWRFGIGSIAQRPLASMLQILAMGTGLLVLLILAVLRGDLMQAWQSSLPQQAPNHFLINIQPDQRTALQQFFTGEHLDAPVLLPMVRGRLTAIGDRTVTPEQYQDPQASRLVAREFNLSWTRALAADNQVTAGQWWRDRPAGGAEFSVEQDLAQRLGIKLGDRLTFTAADRTVTATVTSLRKVDWDSFRVNFFVLMPPGHLEQLPASYITSLYLPADDASRVNRLVRQFPNITVLDVGALLDQVRDIMQRVSHVVEYVFVFTVLSGLLVMVATLQMSLDERRRDHALLRTLGASRRQLQGGLMAEFAGIGLLAGAVAGIGANVVGTVLAQRIFHIGYLFDPWLLGYGILAGVGGSAVIGAVALRQILNAPPLRTLQDG